MAEHTQGQQLPFLKLDIVNMFQHGMLPRYINVMEASQLRKSTSLPDSLPTSHFGVSDLVSFQPTTVIESAVAALKPEQMVEATQNTKINAMVPSITPGLLESVSNVTGIAVVATHEYKITGQMSIKRLLERLLERGLHRGPDVVQNIVRALNAWQNDRNNISNLLRIAA